MKFNPPLFFVFTFDQHNDIENGQTQLVGALLYGNNPHNQVMGDVQDTTLQTYY
jgi:hypothetical protein